MCRSVHHTLECGCRIRSSHVSPHRECLYIPSSPPPSIYKERINVSTSLITSFRARPKSSVWTTRTFPEPPKVRSQRDSRVAPSLVGASNMTHAVWILRRCRIASAVDRNVLLSFATALSQNINQNGIGFICAALTRRTLVQNRVSRVFELV